MMRKQFLAIFLLSSFFGCDAGPESQPSRDASTAPDSSVSELNVNQFETFSRVDSSLGQTIYVPVYSHIYQQNQGMTFNLTATLSIRNTDLINTFTLSRVLYYDSGGKLVKNYLEEPISIKPLASTSFVVEENDLRGGVGANFIVVWKAEEPVFPPVVEAVMISTSQQQGISFLSVGRVLENLNPDSLTSQ